MSKDSLAKLRAEAAHCTACPLYKHATQTVFGEGPAQAKFVFVGEQPGDQEDLAGKPFVGPAGQMLDRALEEAGIDRTKVYVTNAVEAFQIRASAASGAFIPNRMPARSKPAIPGLRASWTCWSRI